MENKTDKPYSLQDVMKEVALEMGFDINTPVNQIHFSDYTKNIANRWASKATEELRKENEELQTQVSMFQTDRSERIEEMKRLKESNKQMKEIFNMIKPQLVKHGFKGTTEEIEKFIQKSEGDLLKVIIDKSKELDAEQKSHTVTNTDQLRINAMGKSEGDVNKKI